VASKIVADGCSTRLSGGRVPPTSLIVFSLVEYTLRVERLGCDDRRACDCKERTGAAPGSFTSGWE
jgi:hypothetical protein